MVDMFLLFVDTSDVEQIGIELSLESVSKYASVEWEGYAEPRQSTVHIGYILRYEKWDQSGVMQKFWGYSAPTGITNRGTATKGAYLAKAPPSCMWQANGRVTLWYNNCVCRWWCWYGCGLTSVYCALLRYCPFAHTHTMC